MTRLMKGEKVAFSLFIATSLCLAVWAAIIILDISHALRAARLTGEVPATPLDIPMRRFAGLAGGFALSVTLFALYEGFVRRFLFCLIVGGVAVPVSFCFFLISLAPSDSHLSRLAFRDLGWIMLYGESAVFLALLISAVQWRGGRKRQ